MIKKKKNYWIEKIYPLFSKCFQTALYKKKKQKKHPKSDLFRPEINEEELMKTFRRLHED